MTTWFKACVVTAGLLLASMATSASVLTVTVLAANAQAILVPPSLTSPVTLQFFVPDGTHVKPGQPILRINAGPASKQVTSLGGRIAVLRATNAKQLASLQLKWVDAELALAQSRAALAKAAVDAHTPKDLISDLDYDTYQGAYKSAKRDAALKRKQLKAARAAVKRQRRDGKLQIRKLKLELAFYQVQVDTATVHAKSRGVVVHAFQHGIIAFVGGGGGGGTGRYREGSMSFPGTEVGQVIGTAHRFSVRAWALQPDRLGLHVGQAVRLHFDALHLADVGGHITAISAAAQSRSQWGDGQYYRIDIARDDTASTLGLLPGMSVRVQTDVKADHVPRRQRPVVRATLHATGEVIARRSWTATAPQVQGLWQMNITRMAPDGSVVTTGQPLVSFAAGRLAQQLPAQQSKLAEAKRSHDQLRLQLADDKKSAVLAVAKAKGEAEKAQRKAREPKKYLPGIQYRKLVIDRDSTRKILILTRQRATVAASLRKAKMAEANAKVAQAERTVRRMRKSIASLTIRAPRDGLFLHVLKADGTRVDVGDQVFNGVSVGRMPDMHSLAVRAALPERDLRKVKMGQPVRIVPSGGSGRSLSGHIAGIGQNVHSKSSAEPVPVVTLLVGLDDESAPLKPGRSVRVDIPPATEVSP